MNSVQLIGRLTRDPDRHEAADRGDVCRMRLAVPRPDPAAQPMYVDIVCFDVQAAACAEHLAKGDRIVVEGRLNYLEWEAEDGSKRSRHEVIARRIELLSAPERADAALEPSDASDRTPQAPTPRPKDAIPF
jgi:single-strand DNA-binding protein